MKRLLPLLAGLLALLLAPPALADALVDNVNGYTLREDGRLFRFTGMIVGEDGRVKQLLRRGDRRPERPAYLLNGRGRTLIPGLIDAHGHVMGLGFNALQLDLARRDEEGGLGDAPWPPHFPKQRGEPKRVQPSRDTDRPTQRGRAGDPQPGGPPPGFTLQDSQGGRRAFGSKPRTGQGYEEDWEK